jgi:hypothetical protein
MDKDKFRQVLVLLGVAATILVNGLANALPLNGQQTGEISDRFQVYFTPAGYVFSIWGLIYLVLIAFGIYQALPGQRQNPRLRSIGFPFVLSCFANISWIFFWHYELFPLTLIAMLVLLGSLIAIYLRIGTGRHPVSRGEIFFVRFPFSLYLGWISVATIANASVFLDFVNWNGWGIGEDIWMVIMLGVVLILSAAMRIDRRDVVFVLVITWAVVGIAVKQSGTPLISQAAWITAGLLAVLAISILLRPLSGLLASSRPG